MSFGNEQYTASPWGMLADRAAADERADFIRKTYVHLVGAVLAFCGLEVIYFQMGWAEAITKTVFGAGQYGWLIVLATFMGVAWLANSWAMSTTSVGTQYAGLGLYVLAESIIIAPMLYFASKMAPGANVIETAGIITVIMFVGLTAAVFLTGQDFSFLRTALVLGGFGAMAFIVVAILFGLQLGNIFTVVMIVLACGYILYDTSNVMHHYRIGQHVAAALALFASVALLFWYVLRLVMALRGRD